ncbi:MAG: class I SAM-dependent methyltransferase, partial [Desulfovibrionales bacterium]|nr:class I SAM-dependent methyltransferase [Desulfovibrionales bacterium]
DLTLDLTWGKNGVSHREIYLCQGFNFWRDLFPGSPLTHMIHNPSSAPIPLVSGVDIPVHDPAKIHRLSWDRIRRDAPAIYPGRFYPQRLLKGFSGIYPENILPFRCLTTHANGFTADLNPPLAGIQAHLDLSVDNPVTTQERGGSVTDWMYHLLDGVGMQTRHQNTPTQFFQADAFDRRDPTPDPEFHQIERRAHHLDACARTHLITAYQKHLPHRGKILDLMAGWESHLPKDLPLDEIHGIGLNPTEIKANPRITHPHIQDLNQSPTLTFPDAHFDAVICSLSVEYLVNPVAVFKEVARILKPRAPFLVAVSNRWFPEKAIRIWEEIHDFERMGLVLEYFRATKAFDMLSTLSIRGYPRPQDDKYYPGLRLSDPIFLITGNKKE